MEFEQRSNKVTKKTIFKRIDRGEDRINRMNMMGPYATNSQINHASRAANPVHPVLSLAVARFGPSRDPV